MPRPSSFSSPLISAYREAERVWAHTTLECCVVEREGEDGGQVPQSRRGEGSFAVSAEKQNHAAPPSRGLISSQGDPCLRMRWRTSVNNTFRIGASLHLPLPGAESDIAVKSAPLAPAAMRLGVFQGRAVMKTESESWGESAIAAE
ncbi:hypothetical protein SKAU_G00177070 [Synaphobranchus kaupii]|uniref:Uncharacterized protein n=1 Tax=Synaphobranchus kaupii TaxID=118154 RepID=A0A9Q1FM19_SYNKA|nr:hypothetical protein SKAU_G00177070 [Synaphobranchus kaupii]